MANIPALGILLDNLKELVLYNADLIDDANSNDFKELWEDLDALKNFIKTYPGWQDNTELNQELGNRIRDVVLKVENAIETYIVDASKQKNRSLFLRAIHLTDHVSDPRKLSKQIAELREQNLRFEPLQFAEISSTLPKKKQVNGGCGFFKWHDADDVDRARATKIISSLLRKLRNREAEIQRRIRRERLLKIALFVSWVVIVHLLLGTN